MMLPCRGRLRPASVLLAVWLALTGCRAVERHSFEHVPLAVLSSGRQLRHGARSVRTDKGPSMERLGASQLSEIRSISCLQARQLYPEFDCKGTDEVSPAMLEALAKHQYNDVPLGLGNYPSWRDAACRSGGRLLCDPTKLLEDLDRRRVGMALEQLGASAEVRCGALASKMSGASFHERRPFRLGIALAAGEGFAREGVDPLTLQKFGLFVLANWGLMPTYNGMKLSTDGLLKYQVEANCPDAAVLVVLPEYNKAFLSSPSCEFVCAERGGAQVASAVEGALIRGAPLADAIVAGVQVVGSVLNGTVPLSMVEPDLTRKWREDHEHRAWLDRLLRSGNFWTVSVRVAFVGLLLFSLFILASFMYYNCGPRQPALRKANG